jgi:N-acetylglucosaminyl-diphospho-decaprenol L-rhamnosyltransferase
MTSSPLGVVIVSWNVRELLARCLTSLFADLDVSHLAARVIVVDNASRDGTPEMIRAQFPRVELIAHADNLGFAGGNNLGLRACGFGTDHPALRPAACLLLNPDTEVRRGAIQMLLDTLYSRPESAIITARLSYGDGSFQHSAFHFPGLGQLTIDLFPVPGRFYESRLNGRYPRQLFEGSQPFEIDTPLGAVMLLRREAIEQVGIFDDGFALYCEEIDWAARFKEAGWKNLCAPAAHIVHYSGKSTSQVKVESFVKLWTARYRLHTKHPQFAPMWLARRIVIAGMKRKRRGANAEMKAACEKVINLWNGVPTTDN